jgi:hypothetical protein
MSIWDDEWEDQEKDKYDFEVWLDSLEGDGTDEEKYNREMTKQTAYPEVEVRSPNYIMTYSNN